MTRPTTEALKTEIEELVETHNNAVKIQQNAKQRIIEIQAIPESNDVVGLKELYLNLSLSKSKINMVRDVISSGDEITGTTFIKDFYTSSYSNGQLIRQ